jgi:hypothetical protein
VRRTKSLCSGGGVNCEEKEERASEWHEGRMIFSVCRREDMRECRGERQEKQNLEKGNLLSDRWTRGPCAKESQDDFLNLSV